MKYLLSLLTLLVVTAGFGQAFDEIIKSVASDRDDNDRYGYDVDIHGDYAVIGAYGNDFGSENEGAVYVMERTGINNWTEVQQLTNSDQEGYDRFGYSVAIFDDLIVVGAYGEDEDETGSNSMSKSGSVYIFERDAGGTWNEVQKIVASDRTAGDEFGWSVAIYDSTIVVGAHTEEHDAAGANPIYHAGSVYIFDRDAGGTWNQTQKIVASERAADVVYPSGGSEEDLSDLFGGSVAIWNDWLIVGSHHHDWGPGFTASMWSSGAAYIFERDGAGVWNEVQMIQNFDREPWDRFGYDVAIDTNTIVVCSYSEDEIEDGISDPLTNPGSAHIFVRDAGGTWSQTQKIVPLDRSSGDHFGYSLDIHGDYMVLGTHSDDHDETGGAYLENAGSAYIFERDGAGVWSQFQKIDASDRQEDDDFGVSCAIWDYTVMVGAQYQDFDEAGATFSDDAGAVYIFSNVTCEDVSSSQSMTICSGQSVTVGSSTYTATGVYTDVLAKADGCDSVVTTNLTVTPPPSSTQDVSICFGYTYDIGTSSYSESGTYTDAITSAEGCDSIVTTNLTVQPENAVEQDVSICWGESYSIGSSTYDEAGTYVDVLTSSTFCDSTVTTNLTIELPLDVSVSQVDNYLTANLDDASYQWYNCDTDEIVEGATNQSWWAYGIGNFACIVTYNGCTDTSSCVYVHSIGISENNLDAFVDIYPNPNRGQFVIQLPNENVSFELFTLVNELGEIVLSNQLTSATTEISAEHLPAGVYVVRLSGAEGIVSKKLIIK
jgi:hypothetical protein